MRQALNGGGGENNRWYFVAGRKQLAVEKLRNNAIRLIEYSAKQTFSVVIDSRAIRWLLKEISQGGGQTKDNFSANFWHEGMVTISVQRIKNDRGLALKILKLTGNGRQMILIPESNGIHPWGGLVEAIEGIVRLGETQNKGKEVAEQNQMGMKEIRQGSNLKSLRFGNDEDRAVKGIPRLPTAGTMSITSTRDPGTSKSATPSTSTTTERALNPNQEIQLLQSSIFCPWELIEERLTKELNRSASLKPLGEDRVVLFCTSEIERDKLLTRTVAIVGDLIDKACTWKPENREAFAKIAERFGGLLEINILILQRQNLERAVVKVKGRLKGFFPTEVVIPSLEGVLAKISVAKFRVEDRCVDPIQMREFFGLIGASEQRKPVDDNGGDLDLRFENAKDCRVEDPTTKKNQNNKAQWNQGMGSNSKEPNTEGLDTNKVQSEPIEVCDKDKKRTSVSFAVGDIHGFSDPPQEGTSVVLQEHENRLAEEQRTNIQARETNTLNEEIIEVEVEKEGEIISDSEESIGTTEALEEEQVGQADTMSGKMNGL
ncbi:hypothetical protein Sjap_005636 [Stephania japonica]|uniref:Uncharacterized protein n=1 Tax=Stephania japonica TaxID=461633 RepID=A0AAP0PI70_9MAGN